ncbi:MAG TPA: pyridoxal-dependent decarboxylase [Gemmatimonadaceae bacterium]|nr:pyridoxal-dependent decarboxylase [Gemmatimonadaceae bacterium]
MSDAGLGDMDPAAFASAGHDVVQWVADYLSDAEQYPVMARSAPGDVRRALPATPPEQGESWDAIWADIHAHILPGITHWNHPGFFAYFAITGSGPGILAELMTAALNVNAMLWQTSPAATELEQVVLDWLRQLLGLPAGWFGIITDTASISTMLALAAARESRPGLAVRERGLAGRADVPVMRVYASEQVHSSIDKAAITLGFGSDNVVHVAVDREWRMRPDALAEAIREDRARGYLPLAAVATVGTTGTASIDPVPAIADICEREGLWLHVDGAYGGMAAIVPEERRIFAGVERADSVVVNPHKWLFTPIDCSTLYTRHPGVLKRAFSLVPEYLVTAVDDAVVNYMDYGMQLGHRFRALKLWTVMRTFGVDGLVARIRSHCAMAREFAGWVDADPEWERVAPVPLSLVCFRYAPAGVDDAAADALNLALLARVNAGGQVYLSHNRLGGRIVLRLAIGNLRTEPRHVATAWTLLREAAVAVRR